MYYLHVLNVFNTFSIKIALLKCEMSWKSQFLWFGLSQSYLWEPDFATDSDLLH